MSESSLQESDFCEVVINVLGYQEDDEWCALGMEMDLRGYGATFMDALKDLNECIAMQIAFADEKGKPEMVLHPAAPEFFQLFAQVRDDKIRSLTSSHGAQAATEYQVGGIPVPPAHMIAAHKNKFALNHG